MDGGGGFTDSPISRYYFTRSPDDEEWIKLFKDFLRIRTISHDGPGGPYQEAVDFLIGIGREIGLQSKVVCPVEKKPILILTWEGVW